MGQRNEEFIIVLTFIFMTLFRAETLRLQSAELHQTLHGSLLAEETRQDRARSRVLRQ